jgi:hypothetical protein
LTALGLRHGGEGGADPLHRPVEIGLQLREHAIEAALQRGGQIALCDAGEALRQRGDGAGLLILDVALGDGIVAEDLQRGLHLGDFARVARSLRRRGQIASGQRRHIAAHRLQRQADDAPRRAVELPDQQADQHHGGQQQHHLGGPEPSRRTSAGRLARPIAP